MHRTRFRRTISLLVGGGLAMAVALPTTLGAAAEDSSGPQTWALVPASAEGPDGRPAFDYTVQPGMAFTDHLVVRNLGEQPLTVTVYAQDAVQTPENAFEVLTPDEDGARISTWVELDETEVTVAARSNLVVPFSVTIPADAEPGDHPGGIVAVSAPTDRDGAAVQYRVGSRVNVRVGGPIEASVEVDTVDARSEMRWAVFSPAPLDVAGTLENTGNVRISPQTRVRVEGIFGWWKDTVALEGIDQILPGGAQTGSIRLDDVPPIGPLWVTVEVTEVASAGQDVTRLTEATPRTVVVWAVPWILVAAILLLIAASVVAVVNIRRRKRARAVAAAAGGSDGSDAHREPASISS